MTEQINLLRNKIRISLPNINGSLASLKNFKESSNTSKRLISSVTMRFKQWMKRRCKSLRTKSSSAILLSMDSSWESIGQVLIRQRIRNKWKRKGKILLAVRTKNKNNKHCVFPNRSCLKCSTYWLNKRISSLTIKWERSCKELDSKRNWRRKWNSWKRLYRLTQSLNLTFLLTK